MQTKNKQENIKRNLQLAKVFKQQNQISEAVHVYSQILEANPTQPIEFYKSKLLSDLDLDQVNILIETCLEQLKKYPDKTSYNYILAISQAKKGDIKTAIKTYKKITDINSKQTDTFRIALAQILRQHEEVYQYIWNEINQKQFKIFDESQYCYPSKLNWGKVNRYFDRVNNYKVIDLSTINQKDKLILESNSIDLEKLKIIEQDIDLNRQLVNYDVKTNSRERSKIIFFLPEDMINTSCYSSICPITGKKVQSNYSFFLDGQFAGYLFTGEETFYLFNSSPLFRKTFVYFPHLELIIKLKPTGIDPVQSINRWKANVVTHWQKAIKYMSYSGRREVALTHGWMCSTAHHLLNDLTGIQRLVETGTIKKVNKILEGRFQYYGDLEEIFPEIPKEKIVKVPDSELSHLPQFILEGNYFALKSGQAFITEDLAKRIHKVAINKCNTQILKKLENAQKHFPLILMTLRSSGRRMWVSQVQGIANIIQKLSLDFPNLGIVLDGVSRPDRKENSLSDKEKGLLEDDQAAVKQILDLLQDTQTNIYDTIGCTMSESILWAHAVDFYIVPFGGGMAKVTYLANKPGIVYCNSTILETSYKDHWYTASQRENGVAPTYIPSHHIVDIKGSEKNSIVDNYECDWKGIYDEAIKMIKEQIKS